MCGNAIWVHIFGRLSKKKTSAAMTHPLKKILQLKIAVPDTQTQYTFMSEGSPTLSGHLRAS